MMISFSKSSKIILEYKRNYKYNLFLILYFFLYPICKVLYGRKNNWIICERGVDAQDNGFFFYKYLREYHPEINAIYLIKKSSLDYPKVNSMGRVVEYGSIKHFFMMIGSPVKISSHLFGYSPWIQPTLYYRRHKTGHDHIFLQHGITKNDVPGFYYDVCKSLKLFVCGSEPEYNYIRDTFNYNDGIVQYLGFPRFDNLHYVQSNNHILVMPTWRRYLSGLSNEDFINTNFYKEWNSFLNNKELISVCKRNNIMVDLYLHHELQRYSNLFNNNEILNVSQANKKSVQSLLRESSLLITDFSSVFFDFAYMKKPMIFFQFDEERYNKEHYNKGYFDYRRDGFGPVVIGGRSVIKELTNIIVRNYVIDRKYLDNINRFFPLHDTNNCERVYKAII